MPAIIKFTFRSSKGLNSRLLYSTLSKSKNLYRPIYAYRTILPKIQRIKPVYLNQSGNLNLYNAVHQNTISGKYSNLKPVEAGLANTVSGLVHRMQQKSLFWKKPYEGDLLKFVVFYQTCK